MKQGGRYEVVGSRTYRGHEPGTVFEAVLERQAETRALNRGNIRLLERVEIGVESGSFALPKRPAGKRSGTRKKKGSEVTDG